MNSADLRERLHARAAEHGGDRLLSEAAAALERLEALEAAHATLAAFARTAPGRLPQEVQDAVALAPWDGDAMERVRAPAPAGQQGGSDG